MLTCCWDFKKRRFEEGAATKTEKVSIESPQDTISFVRTKIFNETD